MEAGGPFPANGDCYFFSTFFGGLPAPFADGQPAFLRDVTFNAGTQKYSFNLATTRGGTAVTITNSGSTQVPGYVAPSGPNTPAAATGVVPYSNVFTAQVRGAMCLVKALRGLSYAPALSDLNTRLLASGWIYSATGGSGDARWAYQDRYGA